MPLARVVSFEGVSSDRMAQMKSEMEGSEIFWNAIGASRIVGGLF